MTRTVPVQAGKDGVEKLRRHGIFKMPGTRDTFRFKLHFVGEIRQAASPRGSTRATSAVPVSVTMARQLIVSQKTKRDAYSTSLQVFFQHILHRKHRHQE